MGNEVEFQDWGMDGPMHFHDALYYTVEFHYEREYNWSQYESQVITFSTIGYGDVAPMGVVGRIIVMLLIALTFVLVPFETSKLVRT